MQRAHTAQALAARWRAAARRRVPPLAAPPARAGATCSTRPRSSSPLAPRGAADRPGPGRRSASSRSASAATCCHVRRRRQDLAAGRGAGQLRPGRGVLPDADAGLGGRPRRRRAAQRRRRPHLDAPARRPQPSAPCWSTHYERRRQPADDAKRLLRARPSASRRRAPRTRSSTSGSHDAHERLRGRRLRPDAAHRRRRQDLGAAGARHRQPEEPAPVCGARASAASSTSPASRAWCCKLDRAARALRARSTLPYKGTLFGLVGNERAVRRPRPARQRRCAAPTAAAAGSSVADRRCRSA